MKLAKNADVPCGGSSAKNKSLLLAKLETLTAISKSQDIPGGVVKMLTESAQLAMSDDLSDDGSGLRPRLGFS